MHIVGTCMEMCPRKERQMRQREGLLHKFELSRSTSTGVRGISGRQYGGRRQLPEADVNKTVKSFARSAAGLDKTVPEDLRPPEVLIRTVKYLCHEVLTLHGEPFNVIYDYVFDRLRSVRQDLVIQRITDKSAITILEIIIRFHVYSAYRLREEAIEKYDPQINYKHLVDCLKKLLYLYELDSYWSDSRKEFETLYIMVTLESKTSDAIFRALTIRPELNDRTFDASLDLCFSFDCVNFVRVFQLLGKFPLLTRSYFTHFTSSMRSLAFERMAVAYGVSTSKVPLALISKLLLYPSNDLAAKDLYLVGADIVEDEKTKEKFAKFTKSKSSLCRAKVRELCDKLGGLGLEELQNVSSISKKCICPLP